MTMKNRRLICATKRNTIFTLTTRYGAVCMSNLIGGGHFPMTCVIEFDYEEKTDNRVGKRP